MVASMSDSFRSFEAGPDPFGKTWQVEFGWLQTGTSIRHADTVDVKFFLTSGSESAEKIVALPHPHLLAIAQSEGREVTDPWCAKIAARRLSEIVETGEDMEKTLVTLTSDQLRRCAAALDGSAVKS